ncbi:MAG: hypothetical protein DMG96_39770 [Acidobacteria bacterium]|nr:MAG: hypothetical protein DMG96_39770 [Acidobacteriota bacterium]
MIEKMKKNHHYVPQLYFRGFLDPLEEAKGQNVLWCYTIGKRPKRFPTSRVGCKEFFYAFEQEGESEATQRIAHCDSQRSVFGAF